MAIVGPDQPFTILEDAALVPFVEAVRDEEAIEDGGLAGGDGDGGDGDAAAPMED